MLRFILFLLLAVLACASDVYAAQPAKLTLAFCGNTEGEASPCPT